MKIVNVYGTEDLAKVYVARMRENNSGTDGNGSRNKFMVEFVESVQPPIPRDKKWVLIVSSLFGCPVKCRMCDAGTSYNGKLTTEEILEQIDFLIKNRFPDRIVPIPKFKIQFARMGEPSFNMNVLEILEKLPEIYTAPGLMPCISTIAPRSREDFFENLIKIKNKHYGNGLFQLQFSIHSTDSSKQNELVPCPKWGLEEISDYGKNCFYKKGDRKIALNFAPAKGYELDPEKIRKYFDPGIFIIKLTPLNPTVKVQENKLSSAIDPSNILAAQKN